jgi:hypothetical protein
MAKTRIITEEHHRRPRSLGGKDTQSNISYVLPKLHNHWHTLFGNMNIHQIVKKINEYFSPPKYFVTAKFINGDRVKGEGEHASCRVTKCQCAWIGLFKDMTFKQAVACMNNIWVDPSYHIYVKKKQKRR